MNTCGNRNAPPCIWETIPTQSCDQSEDVIKSNIFGLNNRTRGMIGYGVVAGWGPETKHLSGKPITWIPKTMSENNNNNKNKQTKWQNSWATCLAIFALFSLWQGFYLPLQPCAYPWWLRETNSHFGPSMTMTMTVTETHWRHSDYYEFRACGFALSRSRASLALRFSSHKI